MKKTTYLGLLSILLISCGGGSSSPPEVIAPSVNWEDPLFTDGLLIKSSNLTSLTSLDTYLPDSTPLFILKKEDGTSQEMIMKRPYNEDIAKTIKTKYPNLVEIINERFI